MTRFALFITVGLTLASCASSRGRSPSRDSGPGSDAGGCAPSLTACGTACVDTRADPSHCGGCGLACPSGEVCGASMCAGSCPTGLTECGGRCVDTAVDPSNCGACDMACPMGELCMAGTCTLVCPGSEIECRGSCVDTNTDLSNCGRCGVICGSGEECATGTCVPTCAMGETLCGGVCTNTDTDRNHCGMCGQPCGMGETCSGGTCGAVCFSGMTGATWESVSATGSVRGFQAYVPSGEMYMYSGSGTSLVRLAIATGTWETRAAPPAALAGWGSPALSGGALWEIRAPSIYRYDPTANTWSTPRADVVMGMRDEQAMTVVDRDGALWGFNSSQQLIRYVPSTDTVSYFPTGVTTDTYETRLGYDELTHSIYFSGFNHASFYQFDIATSAVTPRAANPEGGLNDIFCTDSCGHAYAAGGTSGTTMFRYDSATDSWTRIPDFPVDHGINGSCSVHEDGWLYVEDIAGGATDMYRISLL